MDHAWEEFDGKDALGPSINFQWHRCPRCGAKVRTGKDTVAIFYYADGRPPPTTVTSEVMAESGIDPDCDQQTVNQVHQR